MNKANIVTTLDKGKPIFKILLKILISYFHLNVLHLQLQSKI
jgi:hypothetical protein